MNVNDDQQLQKYLGYEFKQPHLLVAALSHRSAMGQNNERLEYLGDSILNFLIAEALYEQWPKASEGELSRLRASLVKGETLAEIARDLQLNHCLRLGIGELKSGGQQRDSILADAFEAVIAAIYLDSDIMICKRCVLQWYAERLKNLNQRVDLKDPKTRLQEYCQAYQYPLPIYEVLEVTGLAHDQMFRVQCHIKLLNLCVEGIGTSRRRAEQASAEKCLEKIYG